MVVEVGGWETNPQTGVEFVVGNGVLCFLERKWT